MPLPIAWVALAGLWAGSVAAVRWFSDNQKEESEWNPDAPKPNNSGGNPNAPTGPVQSPIYKDRKPNLPDIRNPPTVPPRRLPKEADGQTATATPSQKSISVKSALTDRKYGGLLFNPVINKEFKIRQVGGEAAATQKKFTEASQKSEEMFELWLAQQSGQPLDKEQTKTAEKMTFWDCAALVVPENLSGFRGKVGFLVGLEPLHVLSQYFADKRLNALLEVSGTIPKKYKVVKYTPKGDRSYSEPAEGMALANSGMGGISRVLGVRDPIWGSPFNPEAILKYVGLNQYSNLNLSDASTQNELMEALRSDDPGKLSAFLKNRKVEGLDKSRDAKVRAIPQLIMSLASSQWFRSGFHRFPFLSPKSLRRQFDDKGREISRDEMARKPEQYFDEIGDAMQYSEWVTDQLDELLGAFPLRAKIVNPDGEEENFDIPNLSEALMELVNHGLNSSINSEHLIQLQIKQMLELGKLFNMGLITHDHAVAISRFLGYKGQPKEQEIDYPFDPKAESLRDFQQFSKATVVGWENADEMTIREELVKTSLTAQVIKSAVWHKWTGDPRDLPHGKLEQNIEKNVSKKDKEWEEYKTKLQNPTGNAKRDDVPTPKIKEFKKGQNQS